MDLNYLYKRQQGSMFVEEHAQSFDVRPIHRDFAERYAARMAEVRMPRSTVGAV